MFASPSEILFSIGRVSVRYYGIIMALALFVGIFISKLIAKRFYPELNSDIVYDISPYLIIGAILGARIYYCLLSLDYYMQNPLEVLQIWHGGISIHGGIIGGLFAGIIYCKKHKLPILKFCDIFSYGLILGQSIGRWGNFFNSEAFGKPTESFLKLYIPIYKRPLDYLQYNYFHPTFLYESILDFCIFLILFFIIRKFSKNYNGIVFFTYLILYSIVRIIIEQVRIDSVLNIFGIPIAQIVSVIIILISLFFIIQILRRKL
jgi:phosphatidylglycerol:prolipoprotein diacylglycerol transferase